MASFLQGLSDINSKVLNCSARPPPKDLKSRPIAQLMCATCIPRPVEEASVLTHPDLAGGGVDAEHSAPGAVDHPGENTGKST